VFDILLHWVEERDWAKALYAVMPKRKFQQGSQGGGGSSVMDDQEEQEEDEDADAGAAETDGCIDAEAENGEG
jgi:tRNA (guanine9-N1)-methyltransferase